jgi:gamma-glutamyltranspeptidase/glutathione hydrolase
MKSSPIHWQLPYASRRSPVMARTVVATSQPLAAQAGVRMLLAGGNAVDATLATAIALTVVEPVMNGIGSDAFAIVSDGSGLQGLNASGRAPHAWSPDRFKGRAEMPTEGWDSVTVPGAVSAWVALSERFGKLPFGQLFVPAIEYAQNGFAVSPTVALQWSNQIARLKDQPGFAEAFMPNGRAPEAGERVCLPDHARTLQAIADTRGEAFYRGELAGEMAEQSRRHGGVMTTEDLAAHEVEWVTPISNSYRGIDLHEIPPNGQGVAALAALGILSRFDIASLPAESVQAVHLQAEAMKLAFADTYRFVSDPSTMSISAADLYDQAYLDSRAALIDLSRAGEFGPGQPGGSETVYLTAADETGMMVSYIQSNYSGFGSGVVVPGTGISLHNRGACFNLTNGHPNCVAGGKRPFHTIIPGFVTAGNQPLMSFGVMGADMQAQGHVQMVMRTADYSLNPQAVADAPRWKVMPDGRLLVEETYGEAVLNGLAKLGHNVVTMPYGSHDFGAAQLIRKMDFGYASGSEPRRDGQAVGY